MPKTPQPQKTVPVSNLFSTETDYEDAKQSRPETHPDQADRLVPPAQVKKRPGHVFTKGEITLHTNMGHRMFYGRRPIKEKGERKPEIVGLIRFIRNVNQICDLAKVGDPYADYWLLELEDLLTKTRNDLSDTKQYLLDMLQTGGSTNRISIKSGISEAPVTLPLEFKYKQYGFMGAELVGLYDEVVQLGLNAKDAAWLTQTEFKRFIGGAGRAVRHCFMQSKNFKYSGAKRDDFAANNQRARSAIERMGFELPEDVLTGYRQPEWMPRHDVVLPNEAEPDLNDEADAVSQSESAAGSHDGD